MTRSTTGSSSSAAVLEQTDLYNGEAISVDVLDDLYYNTESQGRAGRRWQGDPGQSPTCRAGQNPGLELDHRQRHQLAGADSRRVRRRCICPEGPRGRGSHRLIETATSQGAVDKSSLDLASWPDISFVMQGETGANVSLTCAPSTYWQTDAPRPGLAMFQINNGGTFPQSILGLPLFNNYYTVFDRTQDPYGAVRFAPIAPTPAGSGVTLRFM